jgi:hypothetical protein
MAEKTKLKPVLDGPQWTIGGNPDLGELQGNSRMENGRLIRQEVVDHTVFQSADGMWNLWACIRGTKIGRLFYHWRAKSLTDTNWERTGQIIRADRYYGEINSDYNNEEAIRSPFAVKDEKGVYYMFYSAYKNDSNLANRGQLPTGHPIHDIQFCVLTSKDGITWDKYLNEKGTTELFTGPGQARDACVVKINGLWHLYYTGHDVFEGTIKPAFYVRTSSDLFHWSSEVLVQHDMSPKFGAGIWQTECPYVVERGGYYYIFRTEDYATGKTHVFRSEDPVDFGKKGAENHYVCSIDIAATEIVFDEKGNEYVSSSKDLAGGTTIGRLRWVEE